MSNTKASKLRPVLVFLLLALLLGSLAFVATTAFMLAREAQHKQEWIGQVTSVQVSSQQLAKSASEAASGNLEAFAELNTTHETIQAAMTRMQEGWPGTQTPPLPRVTKPQLDLLQDSWQGMSANTSIISERGDLLLSLAEANAAFSGLFPDIQQYADRAARQLTESGSPTAQVFAASRQLVLADRMLRRVNDILQGGNNASSATENLRQEMRQFNQVLNALLQGDQNLGITQVRNQQALNSLGQMRSQYQRARPSLQAILDSSADLLEVRAAADAVFLDSQTVFTQASDLAHAVANLPDTRIWPSQKTGALGLLVLVISVALLVVTVISGERQRATMANSINRNNQRAILKLLDELSALADGDLRVKASVSDEITGAIADAVNYAVERLRELVMGINVTAQSVAESAQSTRTSATRLAQEAADQAEKVGAATESIMMMAHSFDTMADRSKESSEAAHRSVESAHNGGDKVRETIAGMNNIREQIQETSKRIKRLGESTQEIGDIVGLINGIAEQTNVLALNAAIQAASAGGAGKGFAVVADEVQQLAESATQATRRIESLVQTIQSDTSEAVGSMEATTAEVVSGTRLAEDAGGALNSIEKVSRELAKLIEGIASEAHTHSETATEISELMLEIRNISIQTSSGSQHTAHAVEDLAELVLKLRESVSDFKLPRDKAV